MGQGRVSLSLALLPYPCSFSISASLPPVSAVTPLQAQQFSWELRFHPNQQQVNFVLNGIHHGFKLGFCHTQQLKLAKKNKPSADQYASVIDEYLAHEVSRGRVAGPFDSPSIPNLQVSSFSVIPKREQMGKWRLIVDLSSPTGSSVNDGINPEEFTLHYITVDQVIQLVSQFSAGALMAKFDVEAAYRIVPVHPSDCYLLGMKWRNHYYGGVDSRAPLSNFRIAPLLG